MRRIAISSTTLVLVVDPHYGIEAMRRDVATIDDAIVAYDGSLGGFCSWVEATCPGTAPLVGGEPVCDDGRPVTD